MIGRDGRHPAPVVDAGGEQLRQGLGLQVGRRLDRHLSAQDQPGRRDSPKMIAQRRLGMGRHFRAWLGAEILDDDFLDMTVTQMQIADRDQGLDPLGPGFADANQQPRGEWHGRPARCFDRREADVGLLVGRSKMGPPALAQPFRCRLKHQPHGGRDRTKRGKVRIAHQARIEMGQQPCLIEDQLRHLAQIRQGGLMTQGFQRLAGGRVAGLGDIAEREQRFAAAGFSARPRDREHGVAIQIGALDVAGGRGKGAVVTDIPAKPRQGDEHLAGIGDQAPVMRQCQGLGVADQPVQRRVVQYPGDGLGGQV